MLTLRHLEALDYALALLNDDAASRLDWRFYVGLNDRNQGIEILKAFVDLFAALNRFLKPHWANLTFKVVCLPLGDGRGGKRRELAARAAVIRRTRVAPFA